VNRLSGLMPGIIVTLLVMAPAAAAENTLPTIAITAPTEGQHYALNAPISAAWTCDDPGPGASGVAPEDCVATGPVSTATSGTHQFTVNATDRDGNFATKTVSYVVDPDTTAPTITIISPADGQHFARGATITVDYHCDDPDSGAPTCVEAAPINYATGTHTYTVNATNGDGIHASKSVSYTIDPDTTPPTITIAKPTEGQHFALGETITTDFHCDDPESGAPTCVAAGPIDYTAGPHAYTVNATNGDGVSASKAVHYVVDPDTTLPTITITSPVDGQHYAFGTSVAGTYNCADAGGSGGPTCVATTGLDLTVGTHVFTVAATDGAGNTTSKSATYTIDAPPASGGGETPGTGGTPTGTGSSPTGSTPAGAAPTGSTPPAGEPSSPNLPATPRVTLPARASTTALTRGVSFSLSGLKPRSRVELRIRRGPRTIKTMRATANAAGKATFKIRLSRAQLRTLKGKTLTLRFTTTAANGKKKVVTKKLKVV
jgi:hypothetical protein